VNLENVDLIPDDEISHANLELGVSSLTKEYEYLYDEYDVVLKKVKWLPKTWNFNGLNLHKCRNYIIEDCETNMISTGSFIKKLEITNTKLGRLQVYDSNVKVSNCVFDQNLQRSNDTLPPLGLSFDGSAIFKDCKFHGYKTLFSFLSSPSTKITFLNCSFPKVLNFCDKYEYPDRQYSNINFNNTPFEKNFILSREIAHLKKYISSEIK
jgi:hypothetical protein